MRRTGKYNGKMTNNKQSKQVKFIYIHYGELWRTMKRGREWTAGEGCSGDGDSVILNRVMTGHLVRRQHFNARNN